MTIAAERLALVTGGAAGFGLAIARLLASEGARVAVVDVNERSLEIAATELGERALALHADVRSPEDVRGAVAKTVEAFGGLDTVILSAGVIHLKPIEDVAEADWDLTLDVNLKGAFLSLQAAAPHLRRSGRGRVVAISSDAGKRGFPFTQAYCASKFGLIGLIESFAAEMAVDQVTANCVCPVGCPTTGMGQQVLDWKIHQGDDRSAVEILNAAARSNPLGRNATEADIASAAMFFLAEESNFLTGVALDVDGGAHVGALPGVA